MKTLIATTALILATAAGASAATSADFDRFGVDASTLSDTQRQVISSAIASGDSYSEIASFVRSVLKNG